MVAIADMVAHYTQGEAITPDDWIIVLGLQAARINYPVEPVMPATQPSQADVAGQ